MRTKVSLDKLMGKIEKVIDDWTSEASDVCDHCVELAGNRFIRKAKSYSPKEFSEGGKNYINSYVKNPKVKNWQSKKRYKLKSKYHCVIWNKKYQLSHLLETGHSVYTRGKYKYTLNMSKKGPLTIKHRKYTKNKDSMKTHNFDMWELSSQDVEKYIPSILSKELNKIK